MQQAVPSALDSVARRSARVGFIYNILISIMVFVLVVASVEFWLYQQEHDKQIDKVRAALLAYRSRIELNVTQNMDLSYGLATYISLNPELTQEAFAEFAAQLMSQSSHILNFGAARNWVISHVYPESVGETLLGTDYHDVPSQLESVRNAHASDKPVISGPVELLQGGTALIARQSITNARKHLPWGVLSTVLDIEALFTDSFTQGERLPVQVALEGRRRLTESFKPIYGTPQIHTQDPVIVTMSLPSGQWRLLGIPEDGWHGVRWHPRVWLMGVIVLGFWLGGLYGRYNAGRSFAQSIGRVVDDSHRFRSIFKRHDAVMLLLDAKSGDIVDANDSAQQFYGYDHATLTSMRISDINTHTESALRQSLSQARQRDKNYFIFSHRLKSGEVRQVEVHSSPITIGHVKLLFSVIHDVSERLEVERKLMLNAKIFEQSSEGVLVTDADAKIVAVNGGFSAITGYQEDDVLGHDPSILNSGRHDKAFFRAMWEEVAQQGRWKGEIWNRRKDGVVYPQLLSISVVKNDAGEVVNYVGVFSDISKLKDSEKKLIDLAHYDALTGLPNRLLLASRTRQALKMPMGAHGKLALMFLDLDQFKFVNDSHGHAVGDELLKLVSQRLYGLLREGDTLARLGGDEFVVLRLIHSDKAACVSLSEDIIQAMNRLFVLSGGIDAQIGVSIGIAQYPDNAANTEELLTFADSAMYFAKKSGRNTYAFYNDALTVEANNKLRLAVELRQCVQNEELELFYQPQVDLVTGNIIGVEALLRWHHPERGVLSPFHFIDVAEERSIIHDITQWVVETGCRQLKQWQDAGLMVSLAVNISPRNLADITFTQVVAEALEKTGADPRFLELEITENTLIENQASALKVLEQLREKGVGIAIDDFGTGYSSMAYLKRYPISKLKIDRHFIKDIQSEAPDEEEVAIVSAMIAMADSLGMGVVAEGIETTHQQAILRELGCTFGQGFLYSRPVPADEIAELFGIDESL
ncbi:bifunctional diguanylate cyclase/phosphodiesterase [Salinivibrio costicola]|uniref:EAL domain-containing protein n=1 Tax=Salinivibrio costicola TaxID=51367 RepID=A0ABX6K5Y7_SALCS|nr:EAL domain-containing protein [Salinivibrio costicola]QIR06602.1 EAL domain-containing protein [Salinivibrio costicola]